MTGRPEPTDNRRIARHAHRQRRGVRFAAICGAAVALILAFLSIGTATGRPPSSALPVVTDLRPVLVDGSTLPPSRTTGPSLAVAARQGPVSTTTVALDVSACGLPEVSPPATRATTSGARVRRPVAAFLGDSYTTGYVGAGIGPKGWPAIVSRTFGWRVVNGAVAGTGFINPGWTGQTIGTRLAAVIAARPGVVFVAGGHNDRRYGAAAAGAAAGRALARLRAALPDAVIVVIGPIWQDGRPAASIVGLRDRLRAQARSIGALFIDPLRGGWFAGRSHALIGADGIHPTDAGHRHIAALVLAKLRADGRFATSSPARVPAPMHVGWKVPACR